MLFPDSFLLRLKASKLYVKLASLPLLVTLFLVPHSVALATSVDRLALCNLEGYPGKTIEEQITLKGTEGEERSGYWETYYKETEGDDDRMDITSWVSIEPKEYTIAQGERLVFTVRVTIPDTAKPGLWGATSEEAGQSGHSAERRTYLIFRDTITGGNVYSGLLIPVSVKVLGQVNPFAAAANLAKNNIIVVILVLVIIVLLTLLLLRMRAR